MSGDAVVPIRCDEMFDQEINGVQLKSGCDSIDRLLKGGFHSKAGLVSEIVGEAGAGKTQFVLQVLLQSQLPIDCGGLGIDTKSVYVTTEGIGNTKRLAHMAQLFKTRNQDLLAQSITSMGREWTTSELLDHIYVEQSYDIEEQIEILQCKLPTMLEEYGVRLVVIDSIAAVFRGETVQTENWSARSRLMFGLANTMRILSSEYNAIFIVVNQVTSSFNYSAPIQDGSTSNDLVPALGLSWSNCVNQRIMLSKPTLPTLKNYSSCEEKLEKEKKNLSSIVSLRKMSIIFSPYLSSDQFCYFAITNEGLHSA